ncbi:MAG: Ppx/GppA family phosphatase [Candidatus Eisenbacteria bacterium]|nr:Ppx/GppA family phosphatase [Candidatus Eisenbacteria bacterium]
MSRVRSERRAAIDIGTNSVRLLVADVHPDGRVCALVQRGTVTRLGEGLDASGRISESAAARTLKAIQEALSEARATGAGPIVLAATSALRSASNGSEISASIERLAGLKLRVLSGEEEARLVFGAVQAGQPGTGPVVVMDIGGGSTEFAFGSGRDLAATRSLDLGCVRLFERAIHRGGLEGEAGYRAAREQMREALAAECGGLRAGYAGAPIRGVGGTFTAFAMVQRGSQRYEPGSLEGTTLTAADEARISLALRVMPLEERRRLVGEGRADLVLAGAAILDEAVEWFRASEVQVSTHGLRYGLLHEVNRQGAGPGGS